MTELNKNLLVEKKFETYSHVANTDNYVIEPELTVTITLNEYRRLVEKNAVADGKIEEANTNRYTRNEENRQLKEEIKELKAEINEYIVKYGRIIKDEEYVDESYNI